MTPRAVLQHLSPPRAGYPPAVILPDKARSMGIYIGAGRGSGKSRLLGRVLVWQDLMKGVPQIANLCLKAFTGSSRYTRL